MSVPIEIFDIFLAIKIEIMDTTDTVCFILSTGGQERNFTHPKYLNFPIVNFPFIGGNIIAERVYGVYISQLIRYS